MSIYSKFTINDVLLNKESLQKKNKYTCPICFELIYKKSIYQCSSGHYACQECWEKSLEIKQECMICRCKVKSFKNLSRCLVIEQNFSKKECNCIYSFHLDYFIDGANQENEDEENEDEENEDDEDENEDEENGEDDEDKDEDEENENENEENKDEENEKRKLIKDEENGCKEIINVDQLDRHIQNCKFKFVKCSHIGCDRVLRLNSLKEHENQCGFKLVKCEYCACDGIIQVQLENHYDECPKFVIGCPQGCLNFFERDQIKSHIENDCNNSTIQCKYYEYGCKVEMKRSELQRHLENVNHQLFMGKLIDKLSSTLDQSMKIQELLLKEIEKSKITCSELQRKNDELSSLITEIDDNYFNKNDFINSWKLTSQGYTNKWIISNYSNLVENTPHPEYIYSPSFDIVSREFVISIYPNGSLTGKDHLSLFLHNNNEDPNKLEFTLELVNLLDKSKSITRKGLEVFEEIERKGWSKFLASKLINKKNGWLSDDDKLTINIYVKILYDDIEPLES